MRALYLFRHGKPEFADNRKYCLGRKDLPLSEEGIRQAESLRKTVRSIPDLTVIASPLKRAADTCRIAAGETFETEDGFMEIDAGEWDGLAFEEIRILYPEAYEKRGADLYNTAPHGGESFAECRIRASKTLENVLKDHPAGNMAIFTHEGVMKMLNACLTGVSGSAALKKKYAYGTAAVYLLDGDRAYEGTAPEPGSTVLPDEEECFRLLSEYGTPGNVREHCMAVAEKAVDLCRRLNFCGFGLNEEAVRAGALLHDIARTKHRHALEGALWLNSRGYTAAAALVGDHMALPQEEERISEKSVLFLADKLVKGTGEVSLEERYFPEGLPEDQRQFHEIKYRQAVRIKQMLENRLK